MKKIKVLFLTLIFNFIALSLWAGPMLPPTPAGVPIDDGGYILLASGAIYGIYKFKSKRKKK
ncbi:hypothetical protein [Flammeovirga sp. OC4]|uniref:hypothetical protein n=1 Tax=Flammeovirga sp. OC4 TaxID=1382345 RepID=UPI0005C71363|nr:hypothetical protein [Flammeovirga sp. OC4]